MSLPLHTHADVQGVVDVSLFKVLTLAEARDGAYAPQNVLLWNDRAPGFAGLVSSEGSPSAGVSITAPRDPKVIQPGDVVRLRPNSSLVSVLYRRASTANTLFITERCNSRCLMCSQPPRDEDDSWRIAELRRLIRLIDRADPWLGMSGGEPTLLGEQLQELIDACLLQLPDTRLHVLTNGRALGDPVLASALAGNRGDRVTWAVPLYGDNARLHDEVVDAPGSFEETLQGLYELGRLGADVEIRVVLHKLTLERLPQLASFIYRRLPFVGHVALMGLEPMGYAKTNRDRLWIDPADYVDDLADALYYLHHRGLPVSIYNLSLCVLPEHLRPFARQSISDWKNNFAPECAPCSMKSECSGFFTSAGPAWRSRAIRPFEMLEPAA